MKNIVYALILSFFIHILFLLVVHEPKEQNNKKIEKKEPKKQHITYVKLKKKEVPQKPEPVKKVPKKKESDLSVNLTKEIAKKTSPKSSSIKIAKEVKLKKVIKENFVKTKKRAVVKKPKKIIAKVKPKTIVKPTYTQALPKKPKVIKKKKTLVLKKPIPKAIKAPLPKTKLPEEKKSLDLLSKKLQENTLESFLSTPNLNENTVDKITQGYLDLYGDEFKSFTKVQKVFLKRNLKGIGQITQRYMSYPRVSIRTRQYGTNVVEFTLYPNGDISGVLLTTSSGYEALDRGSVNTIEIAYQDYPKPRVATKIKIYMNYILY